MSRQPPWTLCQQYERIGAMDTRLEIQGRLHARRNGIVVRDDVRLAHADDLPEARRIAGALVANGFTVWIYAVERGSGTSPRYRGLATMSPASRPPIRLVRGSGSAGTCVA